MKFELNEAISVLERNLATLSDGNLTAEQLARVMAKQYAEAVGPWRDDMPVMSE